MRLTGDDSIFGSGLDQAELFAAVASAIQTLRSRRKLSEQFERPLAKILNPPVTTDGRFYDPAIHAAIFRAVKQHDLRATVEETRLTGYVDDRMRDSSFTVLRAELLLAVARETLPPLPASMRLGDILSEGDESLSSFLRFLFTQLGESPD